VDAEERAHLADELRAEARLLLVESGLLELLTGRFGDAMVTGSAGYDLMVWRGLDIHMPCEREGWPEWAALGGEIATQLGGRGLTLSKATFRNDYLEPHELGAGLYWGLELSDFADNPWRCDIWGWDPFDFAVRQARDANLRADLDRCDRDLILRLKHEALARDNYYGVEIRSLDIYRFAIAGAGETLTELERWKALEG
jgi:hypothetical protein